MPTNANMNLTSRTGRRAGVGPAIQPQRNSQFEGPGQAAQAVVAATSALSSGSAQANPVRKRVASPVIAQLEAEDVIDTIWSTATIEENASEVQFFQPSPTGGKIQSNYEQVPLPGNYPRDVLAARINLTVGTIRSTDLTTTDPDAILAEFRNGILEINSDSAECLLMRTPLDKVMGLGDASISRVEDSGGTQVYHTLQIPTITPQELESPFNLQNNQTWRAKMKFADGAAFPSAANTDVKTIKARLELVTVIRADDL